MFRRWMLGWGTRKEVRVPVCLSQPRIVLISVDIPDNNDGITVIDITDPNGPSYCFFTSIEDDAPPLSAKKYLMEYYPGLEDGHPFYKSVLSTLRPFKTDPF
jgi:hypothetical protein